MPFEVSQIDRRFHGFTRDIAEDLDAQLLSLMGMEVSDPLFPSKFDQVARQRAIESAFHYVDKEGQPQVAKRQLRAGEFSDELPTPFRSLIGPGGSLAPVDPLRRGELRGLPLFMRSQINPMFLASGQGGFTGKGLNPNVMPLGDMVQEGVITNEYLTFLRRMQKKGVDGLTAFERMANIRSGGKPGVSMAMAAGNVVPYGAVATGNPFVATSGKEGRMKNIILPMDEIYTPGFRFKDATTKKVLRAYSPFFEKEAGAPFSPVPPSDEARAAVSSSVQQVEGVSLLPGEGPRRATASEGSDIITLMKQKDASKAVDELNAMVGQNEVQKFYRSEIQAALTLSEQAQEQGLRYNDPRRAAVRERIKLSASTLNDMMPGDSQAVPITMQYKYGTGKNAPVLSDELFEKLVVQMQSQGRDPFGPIEANIHRSAKRLKGVSLFQADSVGFDIEDLNMRAADLGVPPLEYVGQSSVSRVDELALESFDRELERNQAGIAEQFEAQRNAVSATQSTVGKDGDVWVMRGAKAEHMDTPGIKPFDRGWLGNPYSTRAEMAKPGYSRTEAVNKFRDRLQQKLSEDAEFRAAFESIRGRSLQYTLKVPGSHAEVIAQELNKLPPALRVISGGQVGADRIGLEAAKKLGIATGGTAPKGYRTSVGDDPSLRAFGLSESSDAGYTARTKLNVQNSDITLLFTNPGNTPGKGTNSPGSVATRRYARELGKELLENPTKEEVVAAMGRTGATTINIAGNRSFAQPGAIEEAISFAKQAFDAREAVDIQMPELRTPSIVEEAAEIGSRTVGEDIEISPLRTAWRTFSANVNAAIDMSDSPEEAKRLRSLLQPRVYIDRPEAEIAKDLLKFLENPPKEMFSADAAVEQALAEDGVRQGFERKTLKGRGPVATVQAQVQEERLIRLAETQKARDFVKGNISFDEYIQFTGPKTETRLAMEYHLYGMMGPDHYPIMKLPPRGSQGALMGQFEKAMTLYAKSPYSFYGDELFFKPGQMNANPSNIMSILNEETQDVIRKFLTNDDALVPAMIHRGYTVDAKKQANAIRIAAKNGEIVEILRRIVRTAL